MVRKMVSGESRSATNRHYSDEYADKILRRAANPERFEPIGIKLAK